MIRKRFAVLATALTLAVPVAAASAQANLSITGGSGGQLVFTLFAPVQYTLTTSPTRFAPGFLFRGVGNPLGSSPSSVSGTMKWSVNGGPLLSFAAAVSGVARGSLAANDLYFFGPDVQRPVGWLQAGDVITLFAGTLTTSASYGSVPPTAAEYSTVLFDDRGSFISSDGVSTTVPEPSTYALMAAGLAALGAVSRRRRRALVA